ncbi:MAG TPA: multidrug effflux MFS transporter [Hypericibacter adhaerens]|uniref:multidrug effflux MFS transporter n=1 Tax=Hypericibacter adhaerens TaxID=2602016 RepID=UPI002CDF2DB4|nr:multidrug effflux MFS transporter [Hypericibacter adhaerens]HWA45921.1 multidrug effflux MFS transporter [Hypericibacter adhaerens]
MRRADSLSVTVLLTMLVALGPISTDLYLPSLPSLMQYFAASEADVQLTLSVFLVGLAASQLIYGPLSDRFGRKPVLLAGLGLYLLASSACMLATSSEFLIAARFFQALGACVGPVLCRAVVRDVHGQKGAARVLSYLAAAMAIAPLLGPILGGYLQTWFGWRANFAVLVIYGLMGLVGAVVMLPETNLHRNPLATRPVTIIEIYLMLAGQRRYLGYVLSSAFAYSGIFSFISGSSFVLMGMMKLESHAYGYCFAAVVAGYIAGATLAGRLAHKVSLHRMIASGGAIALLGGIVVLALAWAGVDTVAAIVAPTSVYLFGVGMVMANSMAGAIGPYPRAAGAASALLGFTQMSIAALVGAAIGHAADGTQMPMVIALALSAIAGPLGYWLLVRPWEKPAA